MRRISITSVLILVVLYSPSASLGVGADPGGCPAAAVPSQSTAEPTPIARHSPARPKWGDTLEVIYDPAAPKAAFAPGDEVCAIYSVFPGDTQGWVRLEPKAGLLSGSIPVGKEAGYISVDFVTRERWDRNGRLGVMIQRTDGKPARGANHQEMMTTFSPDSYLSFFEKERSLYPDNYAIYRDKWFFESNLKKGEFEAIIGKELPALEKAAVRGESAELLYSLSYGNLLLGREEEARAILARLAESYPRDFYTTSAFSDYDYQAFSRQWKGEGPEAVRKFALALIARVPEGKNVRRIFERYVTDEGLSFAVVSTVCRAWIRDEPENPSPYYDFALAAKSKGGDLKEAEEMISRALALLLRGNLRLYGDIGGGLTGLRMPAFYALRAELRRRSGRYSDALADIKAARSVTRETRPDHLVIEGSIWSGLGFLDKAQACFVEAHGMGNKEAESGLREIYAQRSGSEEGFAEYLAGLQERKKAAGPSAASSAGKSPAPDFAATTLDGADLKLSDLKGKAVVLNFWFIGCAPCRVEMPGLNKLVEEFAGSDVVFVGFATDPAGPLREFLAKNEFKYRIVPEASKLASLFGVSVYPTHILIGKDGRIEYFLTGGSPERHDQLRPLIQNLLR